jgi:hypothetical protein
VTLLVHALGASGQVLPGRTLRNTSGAPYLSGPGVTALSGVLVGPPGSMGELSLTGGVITVQPFKAVIQCSQDATAGQFIVTNDTAAPLTALTAQNATQYRRGLVVIDVDDSQVAGVASSPTTDRVRMYPLDGTLAASAGAATLPALPDNSLALGEYLIPPTGQTVTLTPYVARTGLRGGELSMPTEAAAGALAATLGIPGAAFYAEDTKARGVWDTAAARVVWSDTQWQTYVPTIFAGTTEITYGATSERSGRYFRRGRNIALQVHYKAATGASWAAGLLHVDYPAGLRPATPPYASMIQLGGVGRVVGSATGEVFVANEYNATPAARRMILLTAADAVVGMSTGALPLTAVGHLFTYRHDYETAFEA